MTSRTNVEAARLVAQLLGVRVEDVALSDVTNDGNGLRIVFLAQIGEHKYTAVFEASRGNVTVSARDHEQHEVFAFAGVPSLLASLPAFANSANTFGMRDLGFFLSGSSLAH